MPSRLVLPKRVPTTLCLSDAEQSREVMRLLEADPLLLPEILANIQRACDTPTGKKYIAQIERGDA